MKRNKTRIIKKENIERKWYLLDAKGKTLGRIAAFAANVLRGKGRTFFSPHMDCGDFLVIVNAKEVSVSGKKEKDKGYFTHSGYPGGAKMVQLEKMRIAHPERILYHAIKGMLPQNKLSDQVIRKLKIYPGPEHPHAPQKPEAIKI